MSICSLAFEMIAFLPNNYLVLMNAFLSISDVKLISKWICRISEWMAKWSSNLIEALSTSNDFLLSITSRLVANNGQLDWQVNAMEVCTLASLLLESVTPVGRNNVTPIDYSAADLSSPCLASRQTFAQSSQWRYELNARKNRSLQKRTPWLKVVIVIFFGAAYLCSRL